LPVFSKDLAGTKKEILIVSPFVIKRRSMQMLQQRMINPFWRCHGVNFNLLVKISFFILNYETPQREGLHIAEGRLDRQPSFFRLRAKAGVGAAVGRCGSRAADGNTRYPAIGYLYKPAI